MGKNKVINNVGAAILAGGKNSRMSGFNKAFIRIGGVPIIQRTLKLLEEIFDEIILVTNSPQDFKAYEKKAIITADIIKDIGPLGGIHSALSVTSKEAVFFMACDMPFLHNALISRQLKIFSKTKCDCLVPRLGASIEPLHAIYRNTLKDKVISFLNHGVVAKCGIVCHSERSPKGEAKNLYDDEILRSSAKICDELPQNDKNGISQHFPRYSIKKFLETINVYYWDLANNRPNRNIFKNLNTREDLEKIKAKLPRWKHGLRRGGGSEIVIL